MTSPQLPTPEQVEKRAYELYLERGAIDGHDVEDWLAAEKELTEAAQEESLSSAPKTLAAASGS